MKGAKASYKQELRIEKPGNAPQAQNYVRKAVIVTVIQH